MHESLLRQFTDWLVYNLNQVNKQQLSGPALVFHLVECTVHMLLILDGVILEIHHRDNHLLWCISHIRPSKYRVLLQAINIGHSVLKYHLECFFTTLSLNLDLCMLNNQSPYLSSRLYVALGDYLIHRTVAALLLIHILLDMRGDG